LINALPDIIILVDSYNGVKNKLIKNKKLFMFHRIEFYCFLVMLVLSPFISIPVVWSESKTISLGEGIRIGELLITFKSVKISPLYETGRYALTGIPIVKEPKENYKFVIITVEGKNIGKRKSALGGWMGLTPQQEFEIEVDKGYFYSPILGATYLVIDLLPEETGEDRLVFQIPKTTKPTKLHCNIKGIKFVVVLDESKFVYPKGAKISIEDYKISHEYKGAIGLGDKLFLPAGYEIYSIKPVIRNSGDLPIRVNFEVEIGEYKEIGARGPYVIPSNSTATLEPWSPVHPWYWQNLEVEDYPRVSPGQYSLKVIIKDESGRVIADRNFIILLNRSEN
jgi:hypothetical protein